MEVALTRDPTTILIVNRVPLSLISFHLARLRKTACLGQYQFHAVDRFQHRDRRTDATLYAHSFWRSNLCAQHHLEPSTNSLTGLHQDANLRQDPDGEDYHP